MKQVSHLITLSLVSGCLLLQGCNSVKKSLGIERDPPDEFSVTPSNQPLDMPPDFFCLPVPKPGMPRPQDVKGLHSTKEQFLGPSKTGASELTPGQKAVLEMAGVEEGQDTIAYELDKESRIESAKGKPVLEQLGIKKAKSKDVINPYEESLDLQKQGIPQSRPIPTE